jgi:phosphonate transport system ATP-binding protein
LNALTQQFDVATGLTPVAISIRNLSKSFVVGKPVFSAVSFDVEEGSTVALLGANGAGKSTLMRCLPRLIEPDQGEITIFETDVRKSRSALKAARSRLGFVFQKHNLVGRLSALSNVVHGAQARGAGLRAWSHALASDHMRDEAMACLHRVGLAHVAGQRADSLSGGQSQRVAIARALMQRPSLVLADEPAASLDPQAGDEVMELFARLMRQEKKTVLFTSHNLEHALRFADRIIVIGRGGILLDAPAQGLTQAELRAFYV